MIVPRNGNSDIVLLSLKKVERLVFENIVNSLLGRAPWSIIVSRYDFLNIGAGFDQSYYNLSVNSVGLPSEKSVKLIKDAISFSSSFQIFSFLSSLSRGDKFGNKVSGKQRVLAVFFKGLAKRNGRRIEHCYFQNQNPHRLLNIFTILNYWLNT